MTLGRTAMASNGYTTPFPRAIDDENLWTSASLSSYGSAKTQVRMSLTSFFVEAIKLSEVTDKMLKALYPGPGTRGGNITVGQKNGGEDSAGGFDVLLDLEATWTRLYINLPPELCWQKDGTKPFDLPERTTVEPRVGWKCLERQRNVLHARYILLAPSTTFHFPVSSFNPPLIHSN